MLVIILQFYDIGAPYEIAYTGRSFKKALLPQKNRVHFEKLEPCSDGEALHPYSRYYAPLFLKYERSQ